MKNLFYCMLLLGLMACQDELITPGLGEGSLAENQTTFPVSDYGPGETPEDMVSLLESEYRTESSLAREAKGRVVSVPAPSVDALAAAIQEAGRNGVVRLAPGDHTQTGTLTVSSTVSIVGEEGTRILFANNLPTPPAIPLQAGIHILGANRVRVIGVELFPADGPGGTAILVQDAARAFIGEVVAENWQFGVVGEQCPRLYVGKSSFVGSSQWQTDPTFSCFGIVVVNGERARIFSNSVQNTVFGIWACDDRGRMAHNSFQGNYNGVVLCTVPPNSFPLPDGQVIGSQTSASRWGGIL